MIYDIVIVGSGIVGATMALALATQTRLKIAVVEKEFFTEKKECHTRVSAITLSSKQIFKYLNVWEAIQAKKISPYVEMYVWDSKGSGEIFFDCREINENALGYIIKDHVIRNSLLERFSSFSSIDYLCPFVPTNLVETKNYIELMDEKTSVRAKLLIAADGAESWVRKKANITIKTQDYQQTAIVATVQTELPHKMTARQCFLSTGPLAFLPLENPHDCSIVWSVTHELAAELLKQEDTVFKKQLAHAFANKLGEVISVSERYSFPLRMRHAKNYVRERIALVGDAAHTLHPLAGQGVNMGLLDAAALTEVIVTAEQKKRAFFSAVTLRRYERWRKNDVMAMLMLVDSLKKLFSNESKSLHCLRNLGLHFVNHLPLVKNGLVEYAVGKRDNLPLLARLDKESVCF